MKRIPMEVPWAVSASDEVSEYRGGQGFLYVPVYCMVSERTHQAIVAEWERVHQTAIPDRLYNESAGQLLELRFEGVAFFCVNSLDARLLEVRDGPRLESGRFHTVWNETGICPDPGFYRIEDSPLKARLCPGDRRFTHWMIAAHDEELHVLARTWEAVPLP